MCSTTRGPAIAPSLVTWPTSTTTVPLDLACRARCATHSRTCATEPGAEVSCSEYSVWIESTTAISGLAFSSVERMRSSWIRSEEHTSELQSRLHLVCRLLLEKKKQLEAGSVVVVT